MDDLYHQQLLDHYQKPRHFGKLDNPDFILNETNSSCGDQVTIYLKTEGQIIKEVAFESSGCAVSIASTSLLLEKLIGKSLTEIENLKPSFMQSLIGVEINPSRLKCLMISAKALNQVKNYATR